MRNASRSVLFTCIVPAAALGLSVPPSLAFQFQPDPRLWYRQEYCALGINAALSEMSTVVLRCVRLWGSCNGYRSTVHLMQSCPAMTCASCSKKDICMRWAKTERREKKETPSSLHPSLPLWLQIDLPLPADSNWGLSLSYSVIRGSIDSLGLSVSLYWDSNTFPMQCSLHLLKSLTALSQLAP